jgi:hypothetical protein
MNVIKKDAAIANIGADDEFPGRFQVILSAPTLDRDGDTLLPDEWKQPLPDHITFDIDHGMSVATTVGSGAPHIDDQGRLIVDGTYSSLPRAQETRTLVNEGHIRTTSVAFMTEKSQQKDGATVVKRELLNGAFVAIPSNREALVLNSKSLAAKAGARNSASDAAHIQAIHDHATALGATHGTDSTDDETKSIFALAVGRKDADVDDANDPVDLISATDAAIDQAIDLFASVDLTDLPPAIAQAVALVQAADASIDELMEVVGIPDPDEDATDSATDADAAAATEKSAAAATSKTAAEDEAESLAVTDEELQQRRLKLRFAAFA